MKPTAIDLFAGAGGLASSLESTGWRTVAALDIDRDAVETLRRNQSHGHLRRTKIVCADIRDVRANDLRPDGAGRSWRPELLAGGPPCQPFSSAGRMRSTSDPRGRLFHEFVRLAEELQPRFILFENVSGLVTARTPDGRVGGVLQRIQREFESIGYACRFDLLNAADFGAPQRRVRLYMIAARRGVLPTFPKPTHSKTPDLLREPWLTLGQFLSNQTPPERAEIVRPSSHRAEALSRLSPGTGLRTGGVVEANRPGGHWGYRQDCFVADLKLPSRTIRAATTPDWLKLRSGLRRLTWRECAALQGFPVDWEFAGSRAAKFRQIGNAVQGDIGRALGAVLFDACRSSMGSARIESAEWPLSFHRRVRYTNMEEQVNGRYRVAVRARQNAATASLG